MTADQRTRPNILLICTDQQRFDLHGCYGNPAVDTPNLDRLAAEGVVFENCYVQNPVCSPSRASLMTGRYVPSHGLYANGVDLPGHPRLFSRELADAGYDCGLVGKLHLGACADGRSEPRVDDGFRTFRWAHDPYPGSSENAYHRWLAARFPDLYARACATPGEHVWDTMPAEAHYSHWVAEETLDVLRGARGRGAPFFLVANFFDPHHGFGAPPEYTDRYAGRELPPVNATDGELADGPAVLRESSYLDQEPGAGRRFRRYSPEQLHDIRVAYYAMVTLVDEEVGRILTELEEQGLAEETLVVFTSDHGEMLGDHQLMLKGPYLFDCAVRVPLVARWPGVLQAGTRRSELVQWIDLAPTLLDAAGVPAPESFQGRSLLELVQGLAPPWRDWALCEYRDSGPPRTPPCHATMLRHDRWKLVVYAGEPASRSPRSGQLFDLTADPREQRNLWSAPSAQPVRVDLLELLLDVLVATEDRSATRTARW